MGWEEKYRAKKENKKKEEKREGEKKKERKKEKRKRAEKKKKREKEKNGCIGGVEACGKRRGKEVAGGIGRWRRASEGSVSSGFGAGGVVLAGEADVGEMAFVG